jgi:hypothetical protein
MAVIPSRGWLSISQSVKVASSTFYEIAVGYRRPYDMETDVGIAL